ncbi:MAG: alanine dehydrogenase, partial [Acidimicrobiia bacterium]|nr:alanine dehydrogenase [Acidimicrobiia bacterium]
MIVGVPREVKTSEFRVAITPVGVRELVAHGHDVVIESDAGEGSTIHDEEYEAQGARIVPHAGDVFAEADMILKVKEPQAGEFDMFRPGQLLFTYLHLAAYPKVADALMASGVTAVAYETVQLPDRSLPLLAPMSEIAGRMATQVGARFLEKAQGGRGVLLGGIPGVRPAKVVIIGGGTSGSNAAAMAVGMQANVTVVDRDLARLRALDFHYQGRLSTMASNRLTLEELVLDADLVI